MWFLIDENLSRRLVRWFSARGHDAEHVEDVLGAAADDQRIAAYARSRQAVIVSKDFDFVDLPGWREGPILLWLRTGKLRTHALLERLDMDWARIEGAFLAGQTVVELR